MDLLQQVSGIDIRRRGVPGTQADLYIRGGGFDQTLLLIDGMKMDDIHWLSEKIYHRKPESN